MAYIVLEGPKNIGKAQAIDSIVRYEANKGNIVCDIRRLPKLNRSPPNIPRLIQTADTFITQEPTHLDIGTFIRNELLPKNTRQYNEESIAHAFALDRENHLKHIVDPLLRNGKKVIQKRNYLSSLIYQTTQKMTYETVLNLSGNKLGKNKMPNHTFILTKEEKPNNQPVKSGYSVNQEINKAYQKNIHRHLDDMSADYTSIESKSLDETVQNVLSAYKKQF